MEHVLDILLAAATVVATAFCIGLAMALPTGILWNWLMPEIFGLKPITLGQALGLNILASMLLGRVNIKHKKPKEPKENDNQCIHL